MILFKGIKMDPGFASGAENFFTRAQNNLDERCIGLMEDYTPVAMERFANRGRMSRSHRQESPGVIINTEPAARREYYTNKGFSGGLRGRLWFERMKADHRDEILKGLKK